MYVDNLMTMAESLWDPLVKVCTRKSGVKDDDADVGTNLHLLKKSDNDPK